MSHEQAQVNVDTSKLKWKVQSYEVLIFGIASILIFFVFYICWPSQEKGSAGILLDCGKWTRNPLAKTNGTWVSGYNHYRITPFMRTEFWPGNQKVFLSWRCSEEKRTSSDYKKQKT